jgi:RNA polymerase sigma-70 factor (ECF subfamily)
MNLSYNEIKRRKRERARYGGGSDTADRMADEGQDPARGLEADRVRKALLELDAKFRSVVVLRLMKGYSTEETAGILKIPLGTVLSRLARGQKALRDMLAEE